MKKQSGADWQRNHLKRQSVLIWLVTHCLITESLAEKIDAADNRLRAWEVGR